MGGCQELSYWQVVPVCVLAANLCLFSLAAVGVHTAEIHHPAKDSHHAVKHESTHDVEKSSEHHQSSIKHAKTSGKKSKHDREDASKVHSEVVHHKTNDAEGGVKKTDSHAHVSHEAHDAVAGGSHHGANARENSKHKKSEVTKGFREQYHKTERKKHDSFHSNGHKNVSWKTYGSKNAKHQSHKVDKDQHGKHIVVKSGEKHARQAKKSSAHKNDDHKIHRVENGKRGSHDKHEKWSKSSQQKHQDKHKYKYLPATKV